MANILRRLLTADSAEDPPETGDAEQVEADEAPEHPLPEAAPSDHWAQDVLGPGFEARTYPLLPDEEGEVVTTIVRHVPEADPEGGTPVTTPATFPVLYIHGWNDYFHQPDLARAWHRLGGAFYALDLRKYGRSLREHQSRGYIESLSTYDEDIRTALAVIRAQHPDLGAPVIMAHSTGGLIASLWAHRHPGALRGLVLNSPWLEMQGSATVRMLSQPVIEQLARLQPKRILRLNDPGHYSRALAGFSPEEIEGLDPQQAEDPYYRGWSIEPAWRMTGGALIRPGWLAAILAGHAQVADGLQITVPVLVLTSARSIIAAKWSPDMRVSDIVLDVDLMARRSLNLGPVVTLVRVDQAVHDVLLSAPAVRDQVYREITRWTRGYITTPG